MLDSLVCCCYIKILWTKLNLYPTTDIMSLKLFYIILF
jgi:hypothetical protein